MLTMWIILGVAAAATLTWRFRTANATLDRILRDGGGTGSGGSGSDSEPKSLPATHDR